MADVTMLRKELVIGYTVAGFLAVLVSQDLWRRLFFQGHGFWTVLENVIVGPVIAFISFVCSIGNVPLAAALWHGGISFGGVVSFIFADLITFPLFLIYRKYYGNRLAIRLMLAFWVVMSAAGLITEGIFALGGWIPARAHGEVVHSRFDWNYTTFLNIIFLGVFAGLYWLHRQRGRFGGGHGYAIDPVCGMQVQTANAPASTVHGDRTIWFCSDRCRERFVTNPAKFTRSNKHDHDHGHEHMEESLMVIDPVCAMTVDPATAAAVRRYDGRNWFFCAEGCAQKFDEDPAKYASATPPAPTSHDHH